MPLKSSCKAGHGASEPAILPFSLSMNLLVTYIKVHHLLLHPVTTPNRKTGTTLFTSTDFFLFFFFPQQMRLTAEGKFGQFFCSQYSNSTDFFFF